jgi:hypothetical protein
MQSRLLQKSPQDIPKDCSRRLTDRRLAGGATQGP